MYWLPALQIGQPSGPPPPLLGGPSRLLVKQKRACLLSALACMAKEKLSEHHFAALFLDYAITVACICRQNSPAWRPQAQPLSLQVKQKWGHLFSALAGILDGHVYKIQLRFHTNLYSNNCLHCRQASPPQPAWGTQPQPPSLLVEQQWAHLLSAVAGMPAGRAYLATAAPAVLQQLCAWLQADGPGTPADPEHVRPIATALPTLYMKTE